MHMLHRCGKVEWVEFAADVDSSDGTPFDEAAGEESEDEGCERRRDQGEVPAHLEALRLRASEIVHVLHGRWSRGGGRGATA